VDNVLNNLWDNVTGLFTVIASTVSNYLYAVAAVSPVGLACSLLIPCTAASTLGQSWSNVIGAFVSIHFAIDSSS
jgi:phage-related minor tail protein